MQTKLFVFAATLAVLFGWTSAASAQYGPAAGPYGPSAPYGISQMPSALGLTGYQPTAPAEAPGGIGCTDAACGCGGNCGDCCDCCPGWCHRMQIFGEFLFLRPRNAEIAYAVPVSGALFPGQQVQLGPVEVLDPEFEPAFRGGIGFTLNECSAIVATYTHFESQTIDTVALPGGGQTVLWRLIDSPFPTQAADFTLDAVAVMDIDFDIVDVDYKGLIAYNCDYKVNYVVGARYANLDQLVAAVYSAPVNIAAVASTVQFDGGGLKLGMEGEYYACNSQWFAYGKGSASLIGGEFRARYFSNDSFDPVTTATSFSAGRLVGIYDLEVGAGWRNYCDNIRVSVGYSYSIWTNVMKNNEWINAVQQNNFVDPSDNFNGLLTFDGLTAKAELLW